jgi:hypothetical protein
VLLKATLLVAGSALLVACSDDDPPGVCIGDCTAPIELIAVGQTSTGVFDLVGESTIEIVRPEQGGWVIYVGVRARNVHANLRVLKGALRSTTSQQVLSLEERPAHLVADAQGWGRAQYAGQDLANIPVCGPVPGPLDFDDTAWRLELSVRDSDGRTASTSAIVRPRCLDQFDGPDCQCDCWYNPSSSSCAGQPDAGVGDAAVR